MPLMHTGGSKKAPMQQTFSRVELKELAMTRSRIANAEALVKHISERIQTENKSVLDRTGLSSDLLRVPRDTPVIVTCGSTRGCFSNRENSPSFGKMSTGRQSPGSKSKTQKPIVIFGSEPDPGEAGVVDPTPNESFQVVSAYLQQIVRDLLDQMTGPSSAKHYDRHVLLVDEMLRREAIYGFTPSMVLSGIGDIMVLLSQALLEGKFLVPPHPTHGISKAKALRAAIAAAASQMGPSTPAHEMALSPADHIGLAVPKMGIESYLPSHVKKPVKLDSCGMDRSNSDFNAAEVNGPASSPGTPALDGDFSAQHTVEHYLTNNELPHPSLRQRSPDSKIVTVQDALYAMIQHCSRPLVCVTLEDQRSLVPAVELLCSVLSRISSEVVTMEDPPNQRNNTDSSVSLNTPRPAETSSTVTGTERGFSQKPTSTPISQPMNDNISISSTIPDKTLVRDLGGLSLEEHQTMTRAIRLASLHAIEAVLAVYDRHIDTIELTKEKERPPPVGSKPGKRKVGVDRMHTDTVTTAILNGLDLSRSEISELLVERWSSILRNAPPIEDHEGISTGHAPLLDSARNVNPFTAKDAFDNDGVDSDLEEEEEESMAIEKAKQDTIEMRDERTRPVNLREESLPDRESTAVPSRHASRNQRKKVEQTSSPATFNRDDSRFRGVLTMAEEEEIAAMLHIFIQLFSISEYAMKSMHSQVSTKTPMGNKAAVLNSHLDVPLHPHIPILVARTLARCAVGDYCSSLCLDLLWQLILSAPHMTSKAILYDMPETNHNTSEPVSSLYDTSATENLFQTLVNFLNSSHREQQREMRNDIVIILTSILRHNTKGMTGVPLDSSVPQTQLQLPLPMSTIDAISAISLVLFDLLCRPELVAANEMGGTRGTAFDNLSSSDSPCMSFVSQQTLLRYAIRFHGVNCPTLRADNLQLKRVGWEFLESFCEWQAVHMSYEGKVMDLMMKESSRANSLDASNVMSSESKGEGVCSLYELKEEERKEGLKPILDPSEELLRLRHATYESYTLVDLCQLGFLDVLLMYCDVHCENTVVMAWTQEELYLLQEESWRLLGAIVQSSESCRQHFGLNSIRQEEIDDVRSHLVSNPGTGNSACSSSAIRLQNASSKSSGSPNNELSSQNSKNNKTLTSDKSGMDNTVEGQHQYYPADVYFIALNGVSTCLAYVTQAPVRVEPLKYLAVTVLATVSRSSDRSVQKSLAFSSPEMVPFLTQLLATLLREVRTVNDTQYKKESKERDAQLHRRQEDDYVTMALSPSVKTLVLSCFSLLENIGGAAQELAAVYQQSQRQSVQTITTTASSHSVGGSTTAESPTPNLNHQVTTEYSPNPRTETPCSATSSELQELSQEIPSAAFYFQQSGGIQQIVAWAQYVLHVNSSALISQAAMNPSSLKSLRPPIIEKELHDNLDILLVLLSCVRALVLGVEPSMMTLLKEKGIAEVLNIIEVLSIASDALPASRTENVNCILRDRSIAVSLPSGLDNRTIEERRKEDFHSALKYSLVVLSDLLVSCRPTVSHFLTWHCRFLPKAHEVGFGAPPHLNAHDNYLNATQLLLALWIKSTALRPMQDPYHFDPTEPENSSNLIIGLRVLNTNLRDSTEVSLRREYARRFLRRRVADRMKVAREKNLPPSSAVSIPELVHYYYYIFGYQQSNLSDEEIALRMTELVNTDDGSSSRIHERLIMDGICQTLGLAVKVFSCLAAIGFDDLVDVPVSPEERAHLIGVAALPALCTDELIISMAEVAKANENQPWGEKNVKSNSHSYLQEKTIDMDQVVEMRPTTPDRRCLSSLMEDVQSRSHELSQLFDLGRATEATQLRELYNRFLITRLRQPVGVASLWEEFNDRNGTCTTCAFEHLDEAEQHQMSQPKPTLNTPDLVSECSSPLMSHQDNRSAAASSPFLSPLATSVSKKMEKDMEEGSLLAVQRSYPGEVYSPNQGGQLRVLSPGTEKEGPQEVAVTSTPSAMAHNIAVYHHLDGTSVAPEGTTFEQYDLPQAKTSTDNYLVCTCSPPTKLEANPDCGPSVVPRDMTRPPPIEVPQIALQNSAFLHTVPTGPQVSSTTDSSKPVDLTVSWPTRPKSSLAVKHLKKERMVKNSLRAMGGVDKQKIASVPPKTVELESPKSPSSPSMGTVHGSPLIGPKPAEPAMTVHDRAEALVNRVIDLVNYAEPEPAYIFPLEPQEALDPDENSMSF